MRDSKVAHFRRLEAATYPIRIVIWTLSESHDALQVNVGVVVAQVRLKEEIMQGQLRR